jgi:hypothetical protein
MADCYFPQSQLLTSCGETGSVAGIRDEFLAKGFRFRKAWLAEARDRLID